MITDCNNNYANACYARALLSSTCSTSVYFAHNQRPDRYRHVLQMNLPSIDDTVLGRSFPLRQPSM